MLGVTELFEHVMGRSGKNAIVIIDEIDSCNYAIGGVSVRKMHEQNYKKRKLKAKIKEK